MVSISNSSRFLGGLRYTAAPLAVLMALAALPAYAQDDTPDGPSAPPRDIGLFDDRAIIIDESSFEAPSLGERDDSVLLPDTRPPSDAVDVIMLPTGELTIQPRDTDAKGATPAMPPIHKSSRHASDKASAPPVQAPVLLDAPDAPIRLAPPLPVVSIPAAASSPAASDETVSTIAPPTDIAVSTMGSLTAASVGVLTDKQGGLGVDVWKDGTAAHISTQMAAVSDKAFHSDVMRDLLVRLALTRALPPEGAGDNAGLLEEKLALLTRMESYDALTRLMEAVPVPERDEAWYRWAVRADLYQMDFGEVCKLTGYAVTQFKSAFWHEKQLFCQAYRKEYDKAALTLALMREQSLSAPDWLQQLVLDVAGQSDSKDTPAFAQLTPDAVAMLSRGTHRIKAAALSTEAWQQSVLLARHPMLEPDAALQAAELAVSKGVLSIAALEKIYTAVSFSDEELATSLDKAEHFTDAKGRALAWRISQRIYTVADSVTAFHAIMGHYRKAGLMELGVAVYGYEYQKLSRALFRRHAFYDAAPSFFTVLFAHGEVAESALWLDGAAKSRSSSVFASGKPLWDVFFTLFEPVETGAFDSDYTRKVDEAVALLVPPRDLSVAGQKLWQRSGRVLEALGYRLPPAFWPIVLQGALPDTTPSLAGEPISPAAVAALPAKPRDYGIAQPVVGAIKEAVISRRTGEALLLMAGVVAHPASLSDDAVATYISALLQLGLRQEALQLAHASISHLLMQEYSGD